MLPTRVEFRSKNKSFFRLVVESGRTLSSKRQFRGLSRKRQRKNSEPYLPPICPRPSGSNLRPHPVNGSRTSGGLEGGLPDRTTRRPPCTSGGPTETPHLLRPYLWTSREYLVVPLGRNNRLSCVRVQTGSGESSTLRSSGTPPFIFHSHSCGEFS